MRLRQKAAAEEEDQAAAVVVAEAEAVAAADLEEDPAGLATRMANARGGRSDPAAVESLPIGDPRHSSCCDGLDSPVRLRRRRR